MQKFHELWSTNSLKRDQTFYPPSLFCSVSVHRTPSKVEITPASAAVHINVASSLYGGMLRKRAITYLVNDTVLAVSVVVVISASQELDTQQNAMHLRQIYVFRTQQLLRPQFLLLNGGFHHRCRRTKWKLELNRSRFAQKTVNKSTLSHKTSTFLFFK